jgi:hypothetical protein
MTDFPATVTCHWPSRPVHACEQHARDILGLGQFMGAHVAVTLAPEGTECSNCVNENPTRDSALKEE